MEYLAQKIDKYINMSVSKVAVLCTSLQQPLLVCWGALEAMPSCQDRVAVAAWK